MSRRTRLALLLRVAAAVVLVRLGWRACVAPFDGIPWALAVAGCSVAIWPGYLYCHHCGPEVLLRTQYVLAVPLYVGLSYLPRLFGWLRRHDPMLFQRVVIGTAVWFAGAALLLRRNVLGDRGAIAAFFIFAAIAAVAWWKSTIGRRAAALAVLIPLLAAWLAWRLDEGFLAVAVALLLGASVFLGVTEAVRYTTARCTIAGRVS